ncbi:MAG TPA: peptidylprolyl isomerase [Gemmatimonadaceae bacterium]|nr:peptidylprolyl isomerase [Gemmatimonadaceae bacterium]
MNHIVSVRVAVTGALAAVLACQPRPTDHQVARGDSAAAPAAIPAAPDTFLVAFQTSKGRVVVQAVRDWSPRGVDRFYELVNAHFYDGAKFFRVLGFMAQFGISGDPARNDAWGERMIADDPVKQSNQRGMLSYAMGGPNTRTTQLFINKKDNRRLDAMGFAPFAQVVEGIDVVDRLYSGYGEGAPDGTGPIQNRIEHEGNAYLNRYFPLLDSVVTARVVRIRQP